VDAIVARTGADRGRHPGSLREDERVGIHGA